MPRSFAIAFTIGTSAYVGMGYNPYRNDFWEWDQTNNVMTQKADFAGTARLGVIGFSIGDKGYIGGGLDNSSYPNDFWEWDQATNSWKQETNILGIGRAHPASFTIGNKGYVGTGADYTNIINEFYEFSPNIISISEEELSNSITAYPSPTSGKFSIQSSRFKAKEIKIFNSNGELVQEETLNTGLETLNFDLSSQPNGIYLLHLKTEQGSTTKKIILSK